MHNNDMDTNANQPFGAITLQIAICEDNARDAQRLQRYIAAVDIPTQVAWFKSGEALLDGYIPGRFQLIFLDIYIGEDNGARIAQCLREKDEQVVLVFTTISEEYALTGYRLNVLKYILKPVSATQVRDALLLARDLHEKRETRTVFVNQAPYVLALNDLYYVEVRDHTCKLHTIHGVRKASTTIEEMAKLLPGDRFLRCHRSYIVNMDYVKGVVDGDFEMSNGDIAYVRVKDRKKMHDLWAAYVYQSVREDRGNG